MEKSRMLVYVFILSALIITACGVLPSPEPTPTVDLRLSDEEFAMEAKSVCDDLQAALEAAQIIEQESVAYAATAANMMVYDLNLETAPQALILRDSLVALADACLVFDGALDQAASENMWDGYTWMLTESYAVFGYPMEQGILGAKPLDIDEAIVQDYLDNYHAVSDAAEALGLDGCQLDDDDS